MTKTRTASLCEQGILLLIVLACSLIVRDTGSRAIAEPARFSVPAANITTAANAANLAIAMERTALDSVTLSLAAQAATDTDAALEPPPATTPGITFDPELLLMPCVAYLWLFTLLTCAYAARHYVFSLDRLFKPQHAPYRAMTHGDWPRLTVFVAAHNEETVIVDCLMALLATTYPRDRLTIIPVNDRSTDNTRALIDEVRALAPELIQPFHRETGKPGKAAALKDALRLIRGDIMVVFDADYLPRPGLLKELVAPFFDPEVGAVMGRVVPQNADSNLLARLLDLERAGGYQVNQQARNNLDLVPQYGGTVGGIRKGALDAVGGWCDDTLAEDTDMTYRLLLSDWRTVYLNHAECYEEVPERWAVRARQLTRWAKGHNQTMLRYLVPVLRNPLISRRCRLDGALLLGVFTMPALLAIAWSAALALYLFNGVNSTALGLLLSLFALFSFSTFGNFGVFFEIVVAARLDGRATRLRLVPINVVGFCVTIAAVVSALWGLALDAAFRRELKWDKTERFRRQLKPER
ncbi:glycosyltransferase family 2 protein [Burkholderia cenocepacia]|uniref:glycosyltransferase family 2 protein n=1 Tax=Burkholderia cenocepacia TaxID=95486 RepID=UPI000F57080C|nr:glycosyltransferase [Burkholderia cenocepacia]RQU33444.1 glycosyltransferase family 2 protein [Burkholderia cenocepacia]RQU58595.1 glycosyltransferase family 2 protein [Burkholderia cenocepacia]